MSQVSASSTLNDYRHTAEICRDKGWGPGTKLIGDEGFGPTIIEITKLGERTMLAKALTINGQAPDFGDERAWGLARRGWQKVG